MSVDAVIAEFLERHPQMQLELMPTDRVVDMIEEGVDVAIRIGRGPWPGYVAHRLLALARLTLMGASSGILRTAAGVAAVTGLVGTWAGEGAALP